MRERLHHAWAARAPWERTLVMALVALVGAILYLWLILSAGRARAQLLTSDTTLQAQSARLDRQALEYQHLRTAPAATVSHTDLRALVQARIDAAGLSRALVRIDAVDVDQVKVVFGAVPYADWLGWVASLRAQQVRLDSCRIEALSTAPGMVSVTATFTRPGP